MATAPGFDMDSLSMLGKLISGLERFNLESMTPELFDPKDLLDMDGQAFFQIQGLANFWDRQSIDFSQHITDLIIGAHSQHQIDLTLVMLGASQKLSVFISLGPANITQTILEGIFPGIQLKAIALTDLIELMQPHFVTRGVMTGIPSRKGFGAGEEPQHVDRQQGQGQGQQPSAGPARRQELSQLERVVRGMYGATWAYMVQAHPRPRNKVIEDRMNTIDLLTQITTRSRVQWQSNQQDSKQTNTTDSKSTSETFSGDMVNYRAQYLTRLLERELERLDQGSAAGQWNTRVYFGAQIEEDAKRLASLLLGTLAGVESRPEPLRAVISRPSGHHLGAFYTFLTSQELASLIQLPREEVPGYAIRDFVRFDVDFSAPDDMDLPLGVIQQNGRDTTDTFNISLDALTKHAVVIGVTGSGKTTTVMSLLDRVADAKRPFLVIEPAKTEYRALRNALAGRADVNIYTLGNETVAPFRLNPFEFETSDEPGEASLLTHIDFLKAVFNAAFILYAPMPQVLEEALHEVYEDKGWDLTNGTNRRITSWEERNKYPIFPTLTDLYYKVEEVTNRLGYDHEVESNVKAGLKSRLGSLRIGSKGLMLDTARGIPMRDLLSTPTILELENIGNDDEKTFLMGLFLARLYEYRRLQAATGKLTKGLQHLIVFEEAHRLLKNTSTQVDTEGANPRAQAIEVFTNMLSEVRAYGQGVLVAEQIPSKLAPDVLKNTNLKIVHRLIAMDDRQSIGQTMNLNDDQQMYLGILNPGMAAVFAEGADHAYLLRLENYKQKITPVLEADLKVISLAYASVTPFQAILDIASYDVPCMQTGGPDPALYQAANKILDSEKSKWLWANIQLRLIAGLPSVFDILLRTSELIETEMSYLAQEQQKQLLRMVIVLGSAKLMYERGAQFGWTYQQTEELRDLLTRCLLGLIAALQFSRIATKAQESEKVALSQQMQQELEKTSTLMEDFEKNYAAIMERDQGPFVGCAHCRAKCLYRAEVNTLLSTADQELINEELTSDAHASAEERYMAVVTSVNDITREWLNEENDEEDKKNIVLSGLSYCATLHAIARAGHSEYQQARISNNFSLFLEEQDED